MKKVILSIGLLAAVVIGYLTLFSPARQPDTAHSVPDGNALATVNLPETLSPDARKGKTGFDAKCIACHGLNAAGVDGAGPPLVHIIYEPSHHGDEAFQRAAAIGVRGHHWPFGNMPPVEGLTRADVALIVTYIRELQRFNGIN